VKSVDCGPGRREVEGEETATVEAFSSLLERGGYSLERDRTSTLQVNVGLLCNQACRHCHLDAGPARKEVMSGETMEDVVSYARRGGFSCIDVTGGAPEMVPGLDDLLRGLAPHTPKLMLRSNLTAIPEQGQGGLVDLCGALGISLVASFPSTSESQTDAQRGPGVWRTSLDVLRLLNEKGYGRAGSGLELDLVANPAGAFLPPDQCRFEAKLKGDLRRRWGIEFNSLFSFANVPLGRYRRWLLQSGNFVPYLTRLAGNFNAETLPGLMCRSLVSVSWDGYLYDCDFNQAAGLPLGGSKIHISSMEGPPEWGTPIAAGDHCYACTAGSGFT